MILQTGGRALGATSTRSIPASRALRSASEVEVGPTCVPFSSIRKMGEILICSLWRKFVEMAEISNKHPAARRLASDSGVRTPYSYRPCGRFHHAKYTSILQE